MIKVDKEASHIEGTGLELVSELVTAMSHIIDEICEKNSSEAEAVIYSLTRSVIYDLNSKMDYTIRREVIGKAIYELDDPQ